MKLFFDLPEYGLYLTIYFDVSELAKGSTQNVGWGMVFCVLCAKRASKIIFLPIRCKIAHTFIQNIYANSLTNKRSSL